ncbi:uncharacterized protein LOC143429653 [Xylocopa sonorina]|uniref:uncharacterized protein LOC143429653 n=1 Tax=Xylocopa sonorina TaxID=1818115 RepID=UPI00403A9E72
MEKRCLFPLLAYTFLLLGRAITEQFDPSIPCQTNNDCVGLSNSLKDTSCRNGYCACKHADQIKNCSIIDLVPHDSNRSTETPVPRICKVNQDCKYKNSICNTTISQCDCQRDYILSSNRKVCLKKAESLDFPCAEDTQCLAFLSNTTCRNGQCNCVSGYHYARNACYKTIVFGKPCNQTEECAHVNGAVCTDSRVCNCPEATEISYDRDRCLSVAQAILDSCAEDVQCSETFANALCIDGRCNCRANYHFEPEIGQCFIDRGLGENCGNTYECYQRENGNDTKKALRCVGNVCVCAETYQREQDRCVNEGVTKKPRRQYPRKQYLNYNRVERNQKREIRPVQRTV